MRQEINQDGFRLYYVKLPATGGCQCRITWQGIDDSTVGWAKRLDVALSTLWNRVSKGWPPEKIMQPRLTKKREPRNLPPPPKETNGCAMMHRAWV